MGKSGAYKEDNEKAKAHVYKTHGEMPCPYDDGTRPARLWHKWRVFYLNMESQFDELAQAYGEFRPDRMIQEESSE